MSRSRSESVSASGASGLAASTSPAPPVPTPTATHSSFIPTRYIKHATLINNCYPSRPDEKGPKSSELSYLVFYTNSNPAKLTKVGVFIERRVVKDRKKKVSDVHCSLEILKTLIQDNKAHLNIFSKNIVSILDALLADLSDLDIVRHCQNVFSSFCSAHDGSTLGVDVEFRTIHDRVVSRFASIAVHKGENSNRYRMIGLRALQSVVSSSAFYACEPKAQLNLVLPAILECLIDSKSGLGVELDNSGDAAGHLRRSVSMHEALRPDNVVTDEDVTAEGIRCLRALFKTPNGSNVKLALGPTFSYLDEHARWWPSTFGIGIVKAIVSSILPQNRYMVANEIIARIDSVESTTDNTLRLQKRATLIAALEAILTSPLSLIGMPVLEILQSLLSALTKSLSHASSGEAGQLESTIQDGLVKCVGGLATHIYYSNQVPHIITHIAGKLSSNLGESQPSTIDGVPTVQYRTALLKCLQAVIKTSKDNGRQEASFHAAEISCDLLTPCLGLLLDRHVEIRTGFAQALIAFLVAEDEGANASLMASPIPSTSSDLYFRTAAHQTLHMYASSSTLTPKDLIAIYGILKALFSHFQDDEFIRVVPMLFSLQDWCQEERSLEGEEGDALAVTRKRAVAATIVSYFQMVVSTFGMAGPQEYLENIKRSRENEQQWVPIEYKSSIEESLAQTTETLWPAPSDPTSPVLTHPLARDHLVTLLTDRFRAGADRFNLVFQPESQSDLLSGQSSGREFGSGVFLSSSGSLNAPGHKGERSSDSRIRVSRHLEDWALPKIFPQGSSSELSTTEEVSEGGISRESSFAGGLLSEGSLTSKKIGVDNLKAALAAAQLALDATSDGGSSSAGSQNGTLGASALQRLPLSIRKQPSTASTTSTLRPDLADLLNTIKADRPGSAGSRMSLVVPPYM